VPALRLLAALHQLVLGGRAPELAAFYSSAGGTRPPADAWPAALAALEEHSDWVHERLGRTVQTNDPGRAVALYAALLWLTERHALPIRLLELGASAGLNLHADRYCYVVGGEELGDPASLVRLAEPWERGPDIDAAGAARRLRIVERAGCDVAPLDPGDPEDRLTLLSYIWPDEPERLARTRAAMDVAAAHPGLVAPERAGPWLRARLSKPEEEPALTVVWHSLFRQYVDAGEWEQLEALHPGPPVVWLSMEPGEDHVAGVRLTLRESPGSPERLLAHCGDHGAPVVWATPAPSPAP
jgi:hypothetical protein